MVFKALFSTSLALLPIAITFGVYFSIEHQNIIDVINGKIPPGATPTNGAGGGGPGSPGFPPVVAGTNTYCQLQYGAEPYPGKYLFNPNQWNPIPGGALCMNVTTNPEMSVNDTYASNWTVTWFFNQGDPTNPVHAFPNAKLDTNAIPNQLSNISSILLDVSWTYASGDDAVTEVDSNSLLASNLNANVAVDMFLDPDQSNSMDPSSASHEVMVWLGQYGLATEPLGQNTGVVTTQSVNGTTFSLYYGQNGASQHTFTWVASENTTSFTGHIDPLITSLAQIANGPSTASYIGYYAFGSEILYAATNMTFSVQKLDLEVK